MSYHAFTALIAALCISITVTSATAFDNSNNYAPQLQIGRTALACKPPLDRSDRDPVISSSVALDLSDRYEPTRLDVTHSLFSGREIDRGAQYSNDGVWKTAVLNEWFWRGRLMRNPHVGRLYLTAQGRWVYEEHLFHDGRPDKVLSEACFEGDV
jgi:hypothetical protein